MPSEIDGNWDSCKMFVLNELKRMNDWLSHMDKNLDDISAQMTALKTKMAFIGAAAGLIVSAIFSLIIKVVVK
jgi:hypothetical protein